MCENCLSWLCNGAPNTRQGQSGRGREQKLVERGVGGAARQRDTPEDKRGRELNKEWRRVMEIKKNDVRGAKFADLPLLIRGEALALWQTIQRAGKNGTCLAKRSLANLSLKRQICFRLATVSRP